MMAHSDQLDTRELGRRVRWYINVRWFFLLSLSLPGITTEYFAQGLSPTVIKDIQVALIGLAYNAMFAVISRFGKKNHIYQSILAVAQVVTDVLLTTYLIYAHGGIESRTIVVYAIPIILSGALFGRTAIYLTSIISALLYDLVLLLDWFKVAPSLGILVPWQHTEGGYLLTSIFFYSASLIIIGTVSDFVIKLLKSSERRTAEQTANLSSAQHLAKLGSWERDIKTGAIKWSDEMYRIFGLEPGLPVDADSFFKYLVPEDAKVVRKALEKAIVDHQPFNIEYRVIWPDKSVHHVSAQAQVDVLVTGEPVKIRGVAKDVTVDKQAQTSLDRRSRELEKINQLMIGRELKMAELKQRIKELEAEKTKK